MDKVLLIQNAKRYTHLILKKPVLNVGFKVMGWLLQGIGWLQQGVAYVFGMGVSYAYTRRPVSHVELALLYKYYAVLPDQVRVLTLGLLCEAGREQDARMLRESMHRPHPLEAVGSVVYSYLKQPPENWAKGLYETDNWEDLLDYLRGKSVVIVGNSPCEKGRGLGKTIDDFDVVMRFNNFHRDFASYADDYGQRTHIWVNSTSQVVPFSAQTMDSVQYVLCSGEFKYRPIPHLLPQLLALYEHAPEKLVLLPLSVYRRALAPLPFGVSSGLQIIELLAQFKIDFRFCGFRPEEQEQGYVLHFNSGQQQSGALHDWQREGRYLQKHYEDRRL